ncbi:DUF4147 domain-containing protein [Thermostilla marina]
MKKTPAQLRADAVRIWQAGVDAVRSDVLVRAAMRIDGTRLLLGRDEEIVVDLKTVARVCVVGAGKAGAGMTTAVEEVFGDAWADRTSLHGWVNVPADCVRKTRFIRLHAARPAGVNEPRPEGVEGTERILKLVGALGPNDLCICLISGGGSALMPAPIDGITWEDKLAVTQFLSAAGANIRELNCVRKQLSAVKGGGLAAACGAGRLVSLIISDVLGDPLDVIASGPTVRNTESASEALDVLERFGARAAGISERVFEALQRAVATERQRTSGKAEITTACGGQVENVIIGNNATAVDAAGIEADRLGYAAAMTSAVELEGKVEDVAERHVEMALRMREQPGVDCLITGGEPVVTLAPKEIRGVGGRNQQLVLAAAAMLWDDGAGDIAVLSGGTDGEDGPTDAAGAVCDAEVIALAKEMGLHPEDFLRRNDAYHFFDQLGALVRCGPTDTNVCDLRVVLVSR